MTILDSRRLHPDFGKFKEHIIGNLAKSNRIRDKISKYKPTDLYAIMNDIEMSEINFVDLIASFLDLPFIAVLHNEQFEENILSSDFCAWNSVVPIVTETGNLAFLLSNPFDYELLDVLRKKAAPDQPLRLIITTPENIKSLIKNIVEKPVKSSEDVKENTFTIKDEKDISITATNIDDIEPINEMQLEQRPVVQLSNNILYTSVMQRASDIHIEPKENKTIVRYRIDGDLKDIYTLERETGSMVISRLKALAGIDIAERMKPQDGSLEATISKRTFILRLATTSTPYGESLIIRILEPLVKPKDLDKLGMSDAQIKTMKDFSTRRYGLILVVGPTGSGKTTTIYSFLSHLDTKTRSLISVEDPVEYRIPNANQQQVNDKAGVTFEALLKSSVRQDPDILYLGEIRDMFSARICVDFASTGHMAISTLHTNNATTAIFRLERLGVGREVMADALLGIIAQRLFKKLCPHCKKILPITPQEKEMLSPFLEELPAETAHPVGCDQCIGGYNGREGVYEVLAFDAEIAELIRTGAPIAEIREFIQRKGGYLISQHAAQKAKDLIFPVKDVYEKVLVEDLKVQKQMPAAKEFSVKKRDLGEKITNP